MENRLVLLSAILQDVKYLNPVNREEAYQECLRGNNPVLRYRELDVDTLREELDSMSFEEPLLERVRSFLLLYAEALAKRGTPDFTETSLYGMPSPALIDVALQEAQRVEGVEEKPYTHEDLRSRLEGALSSYGLDWRIVLDKTANAAVSVNNAAKTITIREGAMFSERHVKKLIVHEIETHVLRGVNGSQQQWKVLATEAIPGALIVEEGLAAYNEQLNGLFGERTRNLHLIRVLATAWALEMGFQELYQKLLAYLPQRRAFMAALRAKRGLGDTSHPGGFCKDHVYYAGLQLVQQFVENGGSIQRLYAGKIGLQEEPDVGNVLNMPTVLPRFYQ